MASAQLSRRVVMGAAAAAEALAPGPPRHCSLARTASRTTSSARIQHLLVQVIVAGTFGHLLEPFANERRRHHAASRSRLAAALPSLMCRLTLVLVTPRICSISR